MDTSVSNDILANIGPSFSGNSNDVTLTNGIQPRAGSKDIDRSQVMNILQFLKRHNLKGAESSLMTELGTIMSPEDMKSESLFLSLFCQFSLKLVTFLQV